MSKTFWDSVYVVRKMSAQRGSDSSWQTEEQEETDSTNTTDVTTPRAGWLPVRRTCRGWQAGRCEFGRNCQFLHIPVSSSRKEAVGTKQEDELAWKRQDTIGMALKFHSFQTRADIRLRVRTDVQDAEIGRREIAATVRLLLMSGSNILLPNGAVPSPVCVVRAKTPGEAVDLKQCCSTPLTERCAMTSDPTWDFECGFFVARGSEAVIEVLPSVTRCARYRPLLLCNDTATFCTPSTLEGVGLGRQGYAAADRQMGALPSV
jgi:hypothetical protein